MIDPNTGSVIGSNVQLQDFTAPCRELTLSPERDRGASSTEWEVLSELLDDSGRPRLNYARNYFSILLQEDLPVLSQSFKYWRDFDEALLLYGKNRVNGKEMWLGVKCSKRGNDVFSERLDRKTGCLQELEGIDLFKLEDFENKPYMSANLLWVTLTFDISVCSLNDAWDGHTERRICKNKDGSNKLNKKGKPMYYNYHFKGCPCIQCSWNRYITNLRNKYGKILALKFMEAFPDPDGKAFGYPHIHAVLLFKDQKFNAFPLVETSKYGKTGVTYRIKERDEIKKQGKWDAHVDIKAINSGRALGGYLRKHCKNTHGGDDPAALTTQSLLWLKKKQTFSMSSGFRQELHDLITGMHDSKTREVQETLDGEVLDDWIWTAHGVRSCFDVGMEKDVWFMSLEEEKFNRLVDPGGG